MLTPSASSAGTIQTAIDEQSGTPPTSSLQDFQQGLSWVSGGAGTWLL